MKILISAYACEPDKGSEPGIGWNWALEVARRGHKVWVITRLNNKSNIESYFSRNDLIEGVNFVYYDLPKVIVKCKPIISLYVYYELWQRKIVPIAKELDKEINFDAIHYLTFGVFRQNTFLYKLGKPLYIGPVGGGEITPEFLNRELPIKNKLFESFRLFVNKISLYNPYLKKSFDIAEKIYVRTNETQNCLPLKYHKKVKISNDIGSSYTYNNVPSIKTSKKDHFHILFAGRLIHWKGPHLALKAFAKFHEIYDNSSLTVVGEGNFKNILQNIKSKYKLDNCVHMVGQLPQKELFRYYSNSDVFLFPTLHESGGTVFYEAMSFGLPIITIKINSSAYIFKDSPLSIDIKDINKEEEIVKLLSNQLLKLYEDDKYYTDNSELMIEKSKEFSYKNIVSKVYNDIEYSI